MKKKLIAKLLLGTMIVPSMMNGLNHAYALPGDESDATKSSPKVNTDLNQRPFLRSTLKPLIDRISETAIPGKRVLDLSNFGPNDIKYYKYTLVDVIRCGGAEFYNKLFGRIDGLKLSYKNLFGSFGSRESCREILFNIDRIVSYFPMRQDYKIYIDYMDPSCIDREIIDSPGSIIDHYNPHSRYEYDTLLICKSKYFTVEEWLEYCEPKNKFDKHFDLSRTKKIFSDGIPLTEEEKQKIETFFKDKYGIKNLEFIQEDTPVVVATSRENPNDPRVIMDTSNGTLDVKLVKAQDNSHQSKSSGTNTQHGATKLEPVFLASVSQYVESADFKSHPDPRVRCLFPCVSRNAQVATLFGRTTNVCLDDRNFDELLHYLSTTKKDKIESITIDPSFVVALDSNGMEDKLKSLVDKFPHLEVIRIHTNSNGYGASMSETYFHKMNTLISVCDNLNNAFSKEKSNRRIRVENTGAFYFNYYLFANQQFYHPFANQPFYDPFANQPLTTSPIDDKLFKEHSRIKTICINCIRAGCPMGLGIIGKYNSFSISDFIKHIEENRNIECVHVLLDTGFLVCRDDPNVKELLFALENSYKIKLDYIPFESLENSHKVKFDFKSIFGLLR